MRSGSASIRTWIFSGSSWLRLSRTRPYCWGLRRGSFRCELLRSRPSKRDGSQPCAWIWRKLRISSVNAGPPRSGRPMFSRIDRISSATRSRCRFSNRESCPSRSLRRSAWPIISCRDRMASTTSSAWPAIGTFFRPHIRISDATIWTVRDMNRVSWTLPENVRLIGPKIPSRAPIGVGLTRRAAGRLARSQHIRFDDENGIDRKESAIPSIPGSAATGRFARVTRGSGPI